MVITMLTLSTLLSGVSLGNAYTRSLNQQTDNINYEQVVNNYGEPFGRNGGETDCTLNIPSVRSWGDTPDYVDLNAKYYTMDIDVYLNWAINDNGTYINSADRYGYDVTVGFDDGYFTSDRWLTIKLNGYNDFVCIPTAFDRWYSNVYFNVYISSISANDYKSFNRFGYQPLGLHSETMPQFVYDHTFNLNNYFFTYDDGDVPLYAFKLRVDFIVLNPNMFTNNDLYNNGWNDGFNDAIRSQGMTSLSLWNLFGSIADFPHMVFDSLFDYPIWGASLVGVLGALIAIALAVWVIRKLL